MKQSTWKALTSCSLSNLQNIFKVYIYKPKKGMYDRPLAGRTGDWNDESSKWTIRTLAGVVSNELQKDGFLTNSGLT